MSTIKFGLRFGAMAPRFSEQLDVLGLKYDTQTVIEFQHQFEAMLKLRFADLLNDTAYETAQKKLYKQIEKHILKENKLKRVSTHDTTPS